ncbi:23S rRNA (guanosine(2251)-2'-O)-methyltransferase RlmB [Hyphomicrobium sulfonivorans]|uniref:23S rRNA (Guanosine-2'-O-)-methyltransferase rlmB, LSU rRNA Gm2251 n=1 Tax=Hyphomicrobium sulfonivorans TaxID=121290 RepID=A0A109BAT4_HYPSL|nr:23S rRNA (guanosine(2251)-2'-O)-methyltransferase RlmB [Hyphomicrobium sulfonivorans]KWT65359.1 23S rRNA (guanosine-2'-O-) -methyltransferase rlmB, LSU rRNA Gm2251 [Hyphomicrobium sulfonivorans]MBI1650899.1 23S rRNA (guanosine(2251)-2'-O)-methyltransferase RlmB [Hyphomicrobium sulfonivorans]NSL72718.1 23S rRNA (guanosine(2251)-2'-O)-methyltransferase RlmB [Hyphomicrobium sulfonivorans]
MKQPSYRPKGGKRPFQRRGDQRPRATTGQNRPSAAEDGRVWLFGVHAVEAALNNPKRRVQRLLMTENAEHRLAEAVGARSVSPERVTPRDLDRLLGPDTVHQGVLLETEPLPDLSLQDLLEQADTGPLLVLDQVTDPHNVGAILRSAAVFGAGGLVMTRRHSAPLDGTLAKSASGALELVPVALVQNLARTIDELKEQGCLTLGLEGTSDAKIEDETFAGRVALVLGAEGKGLRELTRKSCERLVKISTSGPIASLNVSNAAAIALHHAAWKRAQS